MIRPTAADDAERIVEPTDSTGFFRPHEVGALRGVLDAYFEGDTGHACFVSETGRRSTVTSTWARRTCPTTPGTSGGSPSILRRRATEWAGSCCGSPRTRPEGGRVMFIETSGLPIYAPPRRFYRKNGYDEEAVLRDYYRDGDDLVVFRKRLA